MRRNSQQPSTDSETPSVIALRRCQLPRRGSLWVRGTVTKPPSRAGSPGGWRWLRACSQTEGVPRSPCNLHTRKRVCIMTMQTRSYFPDYFFGRRRSEDVIQHAGKLRFAIGAACAAHQAQQEAPTSRNSFQEIQQAIGHPRAAAQRLSFVNEQIHRSL